MTYRKSGVIIFVRSPVLLPDQCQCHMQVDRSTVRLRREKTPTTSYTVPGRARSVETRVIQIMYINSSIHPSTSLHTHKPQSNNKKLRKYVQYDDIYIPQALFDP